MFAHFTDRARSAYSTANLNAHIRGHKNITSLDILSGLVTEGGGVAVDIIVDHRPEDRDFGVFAAIARRTRHPDDLYLDGALLKNRLPLDPRATAVTESARQFADDFGQRDVGTEHILLALTVDPASSVILGEFGIRTDTVRKHLARTFEAPKVIETSAADPTSPAGPAQQLKSLFLADNDYAAGWFDNLCMAISDSVGGLRMEACRNAAAEIMRRCFGINIPLDDNERALWRQRSTVPHAAQVKSDGGMKEMVLTVSHVVQVKSDGQITEFSDRSETRNAAVMAAIADETARAILRLPESERGGLLLGLRRENGPLHALVQSRMVLHAPKLAPGNEEREKTMWSANLREVVPVTAAELGIPAAKITRAKLTTTMTMGELQAQQLEEALDRFEKASAACEGEEPDLCSVCGDPTNTCCQDCNGIVPLCSGCKCPKH